MLCGQNGSIDLTEWFDSEEEGPKGPAIIECSNTNSSSTPSLCSFQEDNMNALISQLLGDSFISLSCDTASCIQRTTLPHAPYPDPGNHSAYLVGPILVILFLLAPLFYYYSRRNRLIPRSNYSETSAPKFDIRFDNICITSGDAVILQSISGTAKSGRLLAILGPSGSGNSTFIAI